MDELTVDDLTPRERIVFLASCRLAEPSCEDCGDHAHVILLSPPCDDVSTFAEHSDGELTLVCGECGDAFLTVPVAG